MKLRSQSKTNALKYGNLLPETDKNFFKCNVQVKKSSIPGGGIGVFSNKTFQKDSFITWYHGYLKDSNDNNNNNNRYAVGYDEKKVLIGENRTPLLIGKGVAQLSNDAICLTITGMSNNCQLVHSGKFIYLKSLRRISKGEELFCGYGWKYWEGYLNDFDIDTQKQIRQHFDHEIQDENGIYRCEY